ncbi:MAG: tRNA lysidine(34) synthetase TilS, partial [Streptosporangiales bacterium]|nr:tRNA lysidine(34) synthetase TilS [Streptosporangiales bacterium]
AKRADAVADVLDGLGLDPVLVRRVEVTGAGGPEAAARDARYGALDAAAAETGAAAVLLAHTRDDQAETVLLRLARGSGARSLAGMAPVAGRYRRPLLDLPRDRVREACLASGLDAWDDPHNHDPAYARPRVRHDLLPVLVETLGPGVVPGLARTAALLRADADALDAWADRAHAACVDADGLAVAALTDLPGAVRGRVLRRAARDAGCPAGAIGAGHVDAMDELVIRWHGQDGVDLPGAVCCVRRHDRLLLEPRDRKGANGRE